MNTVSLSHPTACARNQTPDDPLNALALESRASILDESVMNLRELIGEVIASLVPFASCRNLRLRASVAQTVAEAIRADRTRLGQLIFHLLNRTIQLGVQGEISLVVWAQSLNPGSQRIFISVVDAAETGATAALPLADDAQAAQQRADADVCLALCQLLAQRMRGELSIASSSAQGPRATFNASFVVEQLKLSAGMVSGNAQAAFMPNATQQQQDISASGAFEPFESRYLDALSAEGVDLVTFLGSWRQSMNDDLERLDTLLREADFEHLRGVLHRLSGAVGLVGAHGLMEALRSASKTHGDHSAGSINAITARARTLVSQLEATSYAYRSVSQ